MPTQEQLQNRLNPQAYSISLPTEGLFQSSSGQSALMKMNPDGSYSSFDLGSLLTEDERRAAGNWGEQWNIGAQRLKDQYGIDMSTLPQVNMADLISNAQRSGVTNFHTPASSLEEFTGIDIAGLQTKAMNTEQNKLASAEDIAAARNAPLNFQQPTSTTSAPSTTSTPGISYAGGSIVDFLNSQGQPSDFASRAQLAANAGIQNYTGTAAQNTQLLGMLGGGGGTVADPGPAPNYSPASGIGTVDGNYIYTGTGSTGWSVDPKFSQSVGGGTTGTGTLGDASSFGAVRGGFTAGDADISSGLESIVETMIKSGKTINPNLTAEELAAIDPAEFLRQAEIEIAPEYKGLFAEVKDGLTRTLTNLGYDLNKTVQENTRVTDINREAGQEDLAGRGLIFSGQRKEFEEETTDKLSRANEAARELAFRGAQTAGSKAEGLIGTENLRGMANLPKIGGERGFEFASAPILGSLTGERSFYKESIAKELEKQERERRAFATSNLSFA